MMIREFRDEDRSAVMHLWNAAVEAGEVVYASMDDDYFERKFCQGPAEKAGVFLVAEEKDGRISGAIHGVKPVDLPGTKPGWSYLTFELVRAEDRGRGIGTALLEALKVRMKEAGAGVLAITSLNPVNLDWKIPGTPGHDHNNMPGLDDACQGAVFFRKHFEPAYHEIAMYRSFESGFSVPGEIEALQMKLRENGIETGRYNGIQEYEYETMCKRVGSPYWQHVLDTEIRAHHLGQPNEDPALWPDGIKPEGPRPLLIATVNNRIVGFTGPVDRQKSGRGWFTGICTDPEYEHRGIATVLFSMLMAEFAREGAAFSTLFTGADNRAQQIYARAGMRIVRHFTLMTMKL